MRSITVRLARAIGGGVDFWTGLPVPEMLEYMLELVDQIEADNKALERGRR